jgi:hypothetical protein
VQDKNKVAGWYVTCLLLKQVYDNRTTSAFSFIHFYNTALHLGST